MKKNNIFSLVLIAAGIILTIVSALVLPDTVITQLSINKEGVSTMPKFVAIAFPFFVSVGGGIVAYLGQEAKQKTKSIAISIVGISIFILMLIVNVLA